MSVGVKLGLDNFRISPPQAQLFKNSVNVAYLESTNLIDQLNIELDRRPNYIYSLLHMYTDAFSDWIQPFESVEKKKQSFEDDPETS